MDTTDAATFLRGFLGKQIRITTDDTRTFVGEFKCTDNDRNVILSATYEYRPPSPAAIASRAATATAQELSRFNLDMTSRFLGLVVVPGQHITRIEVEEHGGA
ncbi:MAG: hypothetical protein M1815_004944 [Lichina confinis]|nr:MAG: hypothetical protein M1815_004944 [Lichina confinis]